MHEPLSVPESHVLTFDDGYEAFARFWPAAEANAPLILYLHGIQSHGTWYAWSASVLAARGAAVLLPDRRGSGRNLDRRGDVPRADRWLADLRSCVAWARSRGAGGPVGVVGISWGGKLAAGWAAEGAEVDALLLVAPGIYPAVTVGMPEMLRIGASAAFQPTRPFLIPLADPALFTDNPRGRQFLEDDALRLTHATARFFVHSARIDRRVRGLPAGSIRCPATLVLAGKDRIINNAATEAWFARVCPAGRIERFAGAPHSIELAYEDDRHAFASLLQRWAGALSACGDAAPVQ